MPATCRANAAGGHPTSIGLIGGHVPIRLDSAIAILPQDTSGKVRALAIASA